MGFGRLLRFGAVGASGALVNLGALHLLAAVLRIPELAASALAVEVSVLWNFVLHDRVTFHDRRRGAWAARALRYHVVSGLGVALQLGTFGAALLAARHAGHEGLGAARYPAQAAGIALAFAWNWMASSRWAWTHGHGAAPRVRPPASLLPASMFAVLLVLHAVPIWLVRWFPTQDGPLHVENVLALLRADTPLLAQHYLANWGAQPNWLTQVLLIPLVQVFPPPIAEKLVLTAYTLLLPVAFRAVLPRGRRGWWASLAVFPFVHAYPFHMGFWNFCWGLALAFLTVGWWVRVRGRLGPLRIAGLAALGAALYLAHAVTFGAVLVIVGALWLVRAGTAFARARRAPARRRVVLRGYLVRGLAFALAMAPGAVLLGWWTLAHGDRAEARIPFVELLAKLGAAYALVAIDHRELFLAMCVSAVLGLAAVLVVRHRLYGGGERRIVPADGWLAAAAIFVVLYFAIPDVAAAGAHISDRNALIAFLCLVAWLAARAAPIRLVRATSVALAALAVAALGVRHDKQQVLSAYLDEYVSAAHAVGPDRVLLPLALAPGGPKDAQGRKLGYRVKPFLHATGWIVAANGGVDLKNSQAQTDHCPVRFRPDRNPFATIASSLGRMEGVPPCVDLRLAPAIGALDYVLVWGATRENLRTPCGAALASYLSARYEPVFLSEPRGLLEVWKPRELTAVR